MSNISKALIAALIPGGIMAVITISTDLIEDTFIKVKVSISVYIMCVLFIFLIDKIFVDGMAKAHFNMWHIGKFYGLWSKKGLIKQVKINFYSSNEVKIKVTRGYDLLSPDNNYGFYEIFRNLKDGKKVDFSSAYIKFLVIVPCFQEQHVRKRYKRKKHMNKEDFLKTWYDFLKEINKYNSSHLSIELRYYFGCYSHWRFYIFSKARGESTTVLMTEYDEDKSGSEEPMYKILKHENNIGEFMVNYFDEIWDNSISPKSLYEFIESGKCNVHFCKKCVHQKGVKCETCVLSECEHRNICLKLIKEFENDMKRVDE